ncbi:MAG: hypothetical protein JSU95_08850 [Betaproteobacteria bacterium]|nr:MAG: hypothetical protein JSU95_08850 [Betaproteobacteria bacterium]
MIDLAAELPRLLPKAIAWAEQESAAALEVGAPLTETGLRLARSVGVQFPERIRLVEAASLPFPPDPELGAAALQTGLLGPTTAGLTLGYAIFILKGHGSNRLISHECRHVHQHEVAGSIATFLPLYLQQIVSYGYHQAPYEIDAREHEIDPD